jgi:hypothetical protein
LPSLLELASGATLGACEVKLEDMHRIDEDGKGQLFKGFDPAIIRPASEDLSRHDTLVAEVL